MKLITICLTLDSNRIDQEIVENKKYGKHGYFYVNTNAISAKTSKNFKKFHPATAHFSALMKAVFDLVRKFICSVHTYLAKNEISRKIN